MSTKPGWEVRHPGVTPQAIHRRVTDGGRLWVPHYCRVQEPDAVVTSVLCSQNGVSSDDWLLEQSLGQERDWLSLGHQAPMSCPDRGAEHRAAALLWWVVGSASSSAGRRIHLYKEGLISTVKRKWFSHPLKRISISIRFSL